MTKLEEHTAARVAAALDGAHAAYVARKAAVDAALVELERQKENSDGN